MADISHSSARFVLTAKWSHHFCNSLCPSFASPAHVSQFQHSMDAAAPATTATTARRLAAAPDARCGQGPSAASKGTNAGAMEKRKVARRDPEKRRLQNLQAQKKYREKLRKRLEDLETLAASVVAKGSTAPARVSATEAMALPLTPAIGPTLPTDRAVLPETSQELGGDSADDSWTQQVRTPSLSNTDEPSPDLSLWDTATSVDPSYLVLNQYVHDADDADFWYTRSLVDCGCPVRHIWMRTGKDGTHYDKPRWIISIGDNALSSDLYMNNIRMEVSCNISAMWANCQAIGLTQETFCEDEGVSPFYRPGSGSGAITSGEDEAAHDGTVSTVQRIFKTLKPDLRPIKEQITTYHHPCVDVFPFPTLRRNILRGVVLVDEDEFFDDLLQGLVCWAGAGLSRRDRDVNTGKVSSGTPWDSRSWEAKPWFLRKYWVLLGGEDGELVRQSQWWRSMRGEDSDIWSSA